MYEGSRWRAMPYQHLKPDLHANHRTSIFLCDCQWLGPRNVDCDWPSGGHSRCRPATYHSICDYLDGYSAEWWEREWRHHWGQLIPWRNGLCLAGPPSEDPLRGTGYARVLPGFDLAMMDSSMATIVPGLPICSGFASRSEEHTSRQKLYQLVTILMATLTYDIIIK